MLKSTKCHTCINCGRDLNKLKVKPPAFKCEDCHTLHRQHAFENRKKVEKLSKKIRAVFVPVDLTEEATEINLVEDVMHDKIPFNLSTKKNSYSVFITRDTNVNKRATTLLRCIDGHECRDLYGSVIFCGPSNVEPTTLLPCEVERFLEIIKQSR